MLLTKTLLEKFEALGPQPAYGELTFYYNPAQKLKRGTYFCTIKNQDGPNDRASDLSRADVWRFNFGLPKKRFEAMFGPKPVRPSKGETIKGHWDFRAFDRLMPHPVYGWMGWVCILNPRSETIASIWPDIECAYEKAKAGFEKRALKGV